MSSTRRFIALGLVLLGRASLGAELKTTVDGPTGSAAIKRIEDNSFLIEEAYNQEDRVVQHVQTFQFLNDQTLSYSFTQEWPFWGRAHQLSVTVPFVRPEAGLTGGVGDVLVNYRYQLADTDLIALSPRFTVVTPTGQKNHGGGRVGFETNLPLSVLLSDSFVTHWNLGARVLPWVSGAPLSFNYGASVVWLATAKFNVLVEALGTSSASVDANNAVARTETFFLNPGFRAAIDVGNLQIVPGVSVPVGVGPSSGTYGAFAYLSLEHSY